MDFRFLNKDSALQGTLVVPVGPDNRFFAKGKEIDKALKGLLGKALARQSRFSGKTGQVFVVNGLDHAQIHQVILIGTGDTNELSPAEFQRFGAAAYGQLEQLGVSSAGFVTHDLEALQKKPQENDHPAAWVALGMMLRGYRFAGYKSKVKPDQKPALQRVDLLVSDKPAAQKTWKALSGLGKGVELARDLVTMPPNKLYAEIFVKNVRAALKGLPVTIRILNKKQMEKLGMGALLSVNHASEHEPYTMIMEYKGLAAKKAFDLALVGKGVTFDTGGISIKPALNMWDMKYDMAGAAAVAGAIHALASRGAKANVVGIVGLVENVISDEATLPSAVVTSMSGQTVEVLNTDAEGRMVLADIMWYVQENYKPQIMLDMATLTGAIVMALSNQYAGLFSEDEELVDAAILAGDETGDRVWHMPIDATLDRQLDSAVADVANHSITGGAGASTGAVFLKRFVQKKTRWAHFDIAGMAWHKNATALAPAGASGYGVRLFDRFVYHVLEKGKSAGKAVKKPATRTAKPARGKKKAA